MFNFYRVVFLWGYMNSDHNEGAEEKKRELIGQFLGEVSRISWRSYPLSIQFSHVLTPGFSWGLLEIRWKKIEEEGVFGNK